MKNDILKIPNKVSSNGLTKLYNILEVRKGDSLLDLELPLKNLDSDFSLLFSFIQLVSTWLRKSYSGNLILPVSSVEEAIAYLNENEFVYPSITLCWNKEIKTLTGENVRLQLKNPSKEYFTKMDFYKLKGSSVPIYCFDHDKVSRGKSRVFYNNALELYDEGAMGFNLFNAYEKVSIHNLSFLRENLKGIIDDFNAIIHEAFMNTDEHAVTNEKGHYLYPNIRAVLLKFQKKTIAGFKENHKGFNGLLEYFDSNFNLNTQNELFLIEISVLDSGPGLYKRYTRNSEYPDDLNEEINIIKDCLYRNNTSEIGGRRSVKGMGLDRILRVIDKKGFVRIRTGRADVFRNMRKFEYEHHETAQDIQLYDSIKNSNKSFSTNACAEGTLISIFYPLELKRYE
ncbi:hypothetical protein [Lacihabitans sp. CS3-21]|uniref:hypothetical protein n=1 Tax=Lacihabitans sp. CS3-21 TaxID=2487332 RepID=UPI0020CC776E|nr:hypothetical protein [Lacihabitans sp. CS3-21]